MGGIQCRTLYLVCHAPAATISSHGGQCGVHSFLNRSTLSQYRGEGWEGGCSAECSHLRWLVDVI